MNAYLRLKSFAHWVKLEKDPSEDRLILANDIEKLLAAAEAAKDFIVKCQFEYSEMEMLEASKHVEGLIKALESEK